MVVYVKGLRYYNKAFKAPKVRDDVITMLAAHAPVKDRAGSDKMIWPGLNPDGTVEARTLLEYQRWLINTHQIGEFLPPHRFVDPSFNAYAVKVLGPALP